MKLSWEELLKTRVPAASVLNSAHMIECIKFVTDRYPESKIRQVGDYAWQLFNGEEAMSHPHDSHYACWSEAREVIHGAG